MKHSQFKGSSVFVIESGFFISNEKICEDDDE